MKKYSPPFKLSGRAVLQYEVRDKDGRHVRIDYLRRLANKAIKEKGRVKEK